MFSSSSTKVYFYRRTLHIYVHSHKADSLQSQIQQAALTAAGITVLKYSLEDL